MEIYLIRHTTPDIKKGVCYGQADLDTTESFQDEASAISQIIPKEIETVYSSPLKRCRKLAEHLFPQQSIQFDDRLKEIHCGEWEMRPWDDIDQPLLQNWMSDFVHVCIPGGESYTQLYQRVVHFFEAVPKSGRMAIVSHGGVMRSLLSYINKVALKESFDVFSIRYGCVVKLQMEEEGFKHAILHNPVFEKEQHRPSYT
jgi:alpha-ribazole phosphatase